jgi:hypothetical protein
MKVCGLIGAFVWAAALLSITGTARADVIRNISTGFNNATGMLLPNGAMDTAYVIGPGGTGGRIGETPLVRTAPIPGTWLPDAASPLSRWLVLPGTGLEGISVGPGTYFFDTVVDTTGFDPATVEITGLRYAADNKLLSVRINGTAVFMQDMSFAEEFMTFHNLGNRGLGLFQSGLNTIRFEVDNQLGVVSPMGLRVEGLVEGQPTGVGGVPDPGAMLLFGLGVFGILGAAWRRTRQKA